MLWIGVDDTDSRAGGCTTSLTQGIVDLFPELRLHDTPHLVRLNPNVPWKTRGNGAIAIAFDGTMDADVALERLEPFILKHARRDETTSPGFVATARAPDPSLYDATVSRIVERHEAEAALAEVGAVWRGGRGVIGAAAAIAWPFERRTWELITYRSPERIGTSRRIDESALRRVEESWPTCFDTYDLVENEPVCIPSSPCPVLWGLRGTDADDLRRAVPTVGPEVGARSTLFRTNQGTDDHLRDRAVIDVAEFESARVSGHVAARPTERGGHIFVEVEQDGARLRCAAYAPTRSFRHTVAALREGDEVLVMGGLHAGPDARLTLGIEKMHVSSTRPRKLANPTCCERAMRSAGKGAGYRCRTCGARSTSPVTGAAPLALGWHEVPSCARRHLARPLKLGAPLLAA